MPPPSIPSVYPAMSVTVRRLRERGIESWWAASRAGGTDVFAHARRERP